MDITRIQHYLQDILSRIARHGGGTRGSMLHPERDWHIVLLSFVILNAVSIVFSTYLFLQINRGEIFLVESEATARAESLNETLLNETLLLFREKAQLFEERASQKPTLPDPSI